MRDNIEENDEYTHLESILFILLRTSARSLARERGVPYIVHDQHLMKGD